MSGSHTATTSRQFWSVGSILSVGTVTPHLENLSQLEGKNTHQLYFILLFLTFTGTETRVMLTDFYMGLYSDERAREEEYK